MVFPGDRNLSHYREGIRMAVGNQSVNLRIPPDVWERVKEQAKTDHRSQNQLAVVYIIRQLELEEAKPSG